MLLACSNLTSLGDFTVKIDENLTIHKNLFLVLTEQKETTIWSFDCAWSLLRECIGEIWEGWNEGSGKSDSPR